MDAYQVSGLEMKYFVLNPNKMDVYGKASREAIRAYADCLEGTNQEFAEDLIAWVRAIEIAEGAYGASNIVIPDER